MKNQKCISVIVPVFNSEKYLEKCIVSILNQTYRALEIIIIDDGSTDNSGKICDAFAKQDSRIIVQHCKNCGVSAARNKGIATATGQYISFVDSDDWLEPTMYESMIHTMTSENADVIIQPFIFHYYGIEKRIIDTHQIYIMNGAQAVTEMLRGQLFSGQVCNKLFKRDILPLQMFDSNIFIYEDMYALWNVFLKCNKIVWSDVHSYHYIMNPSSIMHQSYTSKMITGRVVAQELLKRSASISTECQLYAQLFALRVDKDLCFRAHKDKHNGKEAYLKEYKCYANSIVSHFTRQLYPLCSNTEKIDYLLAKCGRYPYELWMIIYYFFRKVKTVAKRLR